MLTRSLIVVLVLLNASVALWWMLRGDVTVPDIRLPPGAAELKFVAAGKAPPPTASASSQPEPLVAAGETDPAAPTAPATPAAAAGSTAGASGEAAAAAAAAEPITPPETVQAEDSAAAAPTCIAVGPFADRATAEAAQARTGLQRGRLQQVPGAAPSRFRVLMPPASDRAAAQATVQRIVAAGLDDYYIIANGPEANAIALGQYRSREGAERRVAALRAAGFQPVLQGAEGPASWWVQGQLVPPMSPAQARQRSGAARQRSLDCAGLR